MLTSNSRDRLQQKTSKHCSNRAMHRWHNAGALTIKFSTNYNRRLFWNIYCSLSPWKLLKLSSHCDHVLSCSRFHQETDLLKRTIRYEATQQTIFKWGQKSNLTDFFVFADFVLKWHCIMRTHTVPPWHALFIDVLMTESPQLCWFQ